MKEIWEFAPKLPCEHKSVAGGGSGSSSSADWDSSGGSVQTPLI